MKYLTILCCALLFSAQGDGEILTYNNRPQGSAEKPLLLRTFMPDPGLGDGVLVRHHRADKSPKYNLRRGEDVEGEYLPIHGLPAAIGVSYGPELSYCWDTVEGRLLYAWKGGFLDMQPYWGNREQGSRISFGYVPKLVGTMIYQASGQHPLEINRKSISQIDDPLNFKGYTIDGGEYQFLYQIGKHRIATRVKKGAGEMDLVLQYKLLSDTGELQYIDPKRATKDSAASSKEVQVMITGTKLKEYHGFDNKELLAGGINVATGEKVFKSLGCMMCHSVDGSTSHGPSLLGIDGRVHTIKGKQVVADDSYIMESIKNPNAQVVPGFPANYMPPYKLEEKQAEALLLYLKSLKKD